MSYFFTTIMLLMPIGLIIFFFLQERIGDEQKNKRQRFVEDNPQLEMCFKQSPLYKDCYLVRPSGTHMNYSNGGMTKEQGRTLIKEIWERHYARLKELHESKEKAITESVANSNKTVRPKRKP